MTVLPIGTPTRRRIKLSRRQMLQMAAALSVTAGCLPGSGGGKVIDGIAPWPDKFPVPKVDHPGYGAYPDYIEIGETGPWPKILGYTHKRQLEKFADLILPATETAPAPSAVGIADFFDDWTSAPYPWMSDTRKTVHQGFAWLDAQSNLMFSTDWLALADTQAKEILDMMRDASTESGPLSQPAWMYKNLRELTIGAYYTTPEGEADLGHIVAAPRTGDYPGPTGEALEHIEQLIRSLDLSWDDLPVGPPPYDTASYSYAEDEPE